MKIPESPAMAPEIKVWDPLVRVLHWLLVAAFTVAWVTADEESRWHELSGYVFVVLVVLRILWGFIGTRYARFSDFVHSPATLGGYARDLLAGRAKRYLGHNPLGGAMVVTLLLSLLVMSLTGVVTLQTVGEKAGSTAVLPASTAEIGPVFIALAVADDDEREEDRKKKEDGLWEELHEFFANLTLLLVGLHIVGVLIGSLVHRENPIRAMITGLGFNSEVQP